MYHIRIIRTITNPSQFTLKTVLLSLRSNDIKYSQQLQGLTIDLSYQIQNILGLESSIRMPQNLNTLFRDLSFSTSDDFVKGIDLNHRGDGIKARHIPSILRFIQKNTEKSRPKNSVSGSYIWGFEEAENGVEYLSSFEMAQEFYSYISDCQILLTTHSPAFYTQGKSKDSTRFFVSKDNFGQSKYTSEIGENLYETMGLMQLVAPFIQSVKSEYIEQQKDANHTLINQIREVMSIMRRANEKLNVNQVLSVIEQYTVALDMLDAYDHQRIEKPLGSNEVYVLSYEECRKLIDEMKFSAESELFGNEKDDSFKGSIGNIFSFAIRPIHLQPTNNRLLGDVAYGADAEYLEWFKLANL